MSISIEPINAYNEPINAYKIYSDVKSCTDAQNGNAPGQVADSQNIDTSFKIVFSRLLDGSKVDASLMSTGGNISLNAHAGKSVNVVVNDSGQVVTNPKSVVDAKNSPGWTEIRSSELNTASYMNIHKIEGHSVDKLA